MKPSSNFPSFPKPSYIAWIAGAAVTFTVYAVILAAGIFGCFWVYNHVIVPSFNTPPLIVR